MKNHTKKNNILTKKQKKTTKQPVETMYEKKFLPFFEKYGIFFLFGILVLAVWFVFGDFISFKKFYLFTDIGSDSVTSTLPHFINLIELFQSEGIPTWSFSQGMGQNIYPFCFPDIFLNIAFLFGPENIYASIGFACIGQLLFSGLIFYLLLKRLGVSGYATTLGGFMYAFCAYVILCGSWPNIIFQVYMVPLLLLSFEKLFQQNSWWLMVISVCLEMIFNPFNLFLDSTFLGFYILFRFFQHKKATAKSFFILIGKIFLLYIIGISLSAFISVNNLLQMMESPRVLGDASFFGTLMETSVFSISSGHEIFTSLMRLFSSDMIGEGFNFKGWGNYFEAPILYCGLLNLILFPQIFVFLDKRKHIIFSLFFLVYLLPFIFPFIRFAFWAFSGDYYRSLGLFFMIINLLYSMWGLSFIISKNTLNLKLLMISLGCSLAILYIPTSFSFLIQEAIQQRVTIFLISYTAILLIWSKVKIFKPFMLSMLILFVLTEKIIAANTTINTRPVIAAKDRANRKDFFDYTSDAVDYLKSIDTDFYRISKNYTSLNIRHIGLNEAQVQGYYSTSSYHSFNQLNYVNFLGKMDLIDTGNELETRWLRGIPNNPILMTFANIKYILNKDAHIDKLGMGVDSIATIQDVSIYKFKNYLPLGYTYNTVIKESDFVNQETNKKAQLLLEACVIQDNAFEESYSELTVIDSTQLNYTWSFINSKIDNLKKDTLSITQFSDSKITGNIQLNEPKILFFTIPYDKGWTAEVDGKPAKLDYANIGFMGIYVEPGNHEIKLKYLPPYFNTCVTISLITLLLFIALITGKFLWERRKTTESET